MKKENWTVGIAGAIVVSDTKPTERTVFKYEKKELGGYVVCDTIMTKEHTKLIAAAPDMLEALILFTNNVDSWIETGIPADAETSKQIYEMAKQAIKKATE